MKKIAICILAFSSLLFGAGCSDIRQASADPVCADLFKGIEEHLRYDEESRLYSMRIQEDGYNLEFHLIREGDCLKGLSMRSINKLFGSPSRISDTSYFYYMTPNCWKNKDGVGPHDCIQMVFKFDEEGRVKDFRFS